MRTAMRFSCPHFDPDNDWCHRVHDRCICGRPGCVLAQNSTFAIAPAIRLAAVRGMKPAGLPATKDEGGRGPQIPPPPITER